MAAYTRVDGPDGIPGGMAFSVLTDNMFHRVQVLGDMGESTKILASALEHNRRRRYGIVLCV